MPTPEEEFAAFQKWRAENAGAVSSAPTPEDETPPVTVAEVLHALVNSARFPTEETVRTYHAAIDAAFPAKDEPSEASNAA